MQIKLLNKEHLTKRGKKRTTGQCLVNIVMEFYSWSTEVTITSFSLVRKYRFLSHIYTLGVTDTLAISF